jgi:hypothetical protein
MNRVNFVILDGTTAVTFDTGVITFSLLKAPPLEHMLKHVSASQTTY